MVERAIEERREVEKGRERGEERENRVGMRKEEGQSHKRK